jgi:hypothetical protein
MTFRERGTRKERKSARLARVLAQHVLDEVRKKVESHPLWKNLFVNKYIPI